MFSSLLSLALLFSSASAQLAGTQQSETHPSLTTQKCTKGGSCTTQQTKIVLDSNWRWLHVNTGYTNCYTGNEWNTTVCTSPSKCASSCALEGVDYSGTYGIQASGNSLSMRFVTKHEYGTNIGSRVYLMESDTKYKMFQLKNQEFTFDVDVSKLPCGLNGALYFSAMDSDGGTGKYSANKAGAKYGTGYCDAQCPHDMKFINGEANTEDWKPSDSDANAGSGKYGTCCDEMDIWESNSMATAYTPHSCSSTGQTRCSGAQCGDNGPDRYKGLCDKDGCDFNSYRMGDPDFFGTGKVVDSSKKMTVVTQFITTDGTANGDLKEIKRIYVQGGKVIENSNVAVDGIDAGNSITTEFCDQSKKAFGDEPNFQQMGGMKKMGTALGTGMVLSMSIWDDHYASMLWLDSSYPLDKDPSAPGIKRGECSQDSGKPDDVEANSPGATVVYSNIKYGDIGSTFTAA